MQLRLTNILPPFQNMDVPDFLQLPDRQDGVVAFVFYTDAADDVLATVEQKRLRLYAGLVVAAKF